MDSSPTPVEPLVVPAGDPFARARLLSSPIRRAILEIVTSRPGLTVGELLALLDVGWGTLHHHLDRLEAVGLLRTVQAGRRRLVLPGDAPRAAPVARALLAGATCRRVAEAVAREPGLCIQDLIGRVEDSPRAVYHHVKRLLDAGLLQSERPGRYTSLHPTPLLTDLLDDRVRAPRLRE